LPIPPAGNRSSRQTVEAALPPIVPPRPHVAGEHCARRFTTLGSDLYCASSVLAPKAGNSYNVENLFGGPFTAWVAAGGRYAIGQWVLAEFSSERSIRSVTIRNGYQKNADIFAKNTRVRTLEAVFSTGRRVSLALKDRAGAQTFVFDTPLRAKWVQFIITGVYPGTKYADTAISNLDFDFN
jgi:hypothetical protein